jgi:hypothetical protein
MFAVKAWFSASLIVPVKPASLLIFACFILSSMTASGSIIKGSLPDFPN